MKVNIFKPNITQYNFDFIGEDIYSQCMWAKINLDYDNFTMNAITDCGNFFHKWNKTNEKNGFLTLMCKITPEYLLSKISSESVFNLEESITRAIENLKMCDCNKYDFDKMIYKIRSLPSDCDAKTFYMSISNIMDKYFDSESVYVIMDYPKEAKTFVSIFEKYLQPMLLKELRQQDEI